MTPARIFMEGGLFMWPLMLIVPVILGLTLRTIWEIGVRGGSDSARVQNGLDGLLFWGGFAVILGVLGTMVGYNKAMSAVVARGIVNPPAVWVGTAEGLVTTITGIAILAIAGASWFGLRWWHLRSR